MSFTLLRLFVCDGDLVSIKTIRAVDLNENRVLHKYFPKLCFSV